MKKLQITSQMTSSATALNSNLDLRAPVFTRLRRGTGVGWLRVATLISLDCAFLSLAWLIAQNFGTPLTSPWSKENSSLSLFLIVAIEIGLIAAQGLYDCGEKRRDYFSLIKTLVVSHVLILIVAFFYEPGEIVSRSAFTLSLSLSILFTCTGRLSVDLGLEYLRRKGAIRQSIFLICPPEDKEKTTKLILEEKCYNILGWTDIDSLEKQDCEAIVENLQSLGVASVFVSNWGSVKDRMFLYWSLRNAGIMLYILPIGLEPFGRATEFSMIGGIPAIKFSPPLITGSDFLLKRCFDFGCSALLLLVTAPLFVLIALLINLDSPGPVFFKQARVGLHGKQFKVWKFRTMVENADKLQKQLEAHNEMKDGVLFKMKSDPRITRVGKFLRRYSLDELPQLFNVFLGEMSLIGPRPLPTRDIEKMSEHHLTRHLVMPGITGLWQVSGRSDITNFDEAVRLDIFYIENWSILLDWQILLRTIAVVFLRKGAY